jgi:serine/threonine protein kinase/lipopolysaccharide biosynthesis regulator YciM
VAPNCANLENGTLEDFPMPLEPRRVKALFHAALDLPDPADRPAFLDRECGEDLELHRRLEALLAAHGRPASALERPLAGERDRATSIGDETASPPPAVVEGATASGSDPGPTASFRPEPAASPIGTVLAGRYKLRQEIGEGGMGSVYLAEQTQPVKRQVALKLIRPGMDSKTVLARFESERQALALMDHPHIAKVLDAGTTETGRPFFVMELVRGIPLTDYCDRHRLGLSERLALVQQICSAVQHAHQKGIIHRDLKPSNILVESHDGHLVPKVIDFGLAKATSGMPLSEHSLFTALGSVAGTPLYMAPEQASFNAPDIDTRADIYALGVILYELLTGSTPIRRETLKQAALDEVLRVIREVEPPAPSSRISTSAALPSLAAIRQIEPARLSQFVRGDLDWIVMKALAKERQRRYESAIALAQDLERFTHHEPVSAGPPTTAYRFRKFVRRNRPQVIAASLVFLALIAGIVGTTVGLLEARRQERLAVAEAHEKEKARQAETLQREQAERRLTQVAKANEILGSSFKDLNPRSAEKEGKPLSALLGERLDQATAEIEGEAIGDPLAVARMQMTLGESQLGLGYPEKAIDLFTKARVTFGSQLGPDSPEALTVMSCLADSYRHAAKLDQALPLLEDTITLQKASLGPQHHDTLTSMNNLALGYRAAGELDRALALLEETLMLEKAGLGPDHTLTLITMNNLADAYRDAGKLDRALPLLEQTFALKTAKLGPKHADTLTSMNNLALGYRAAGQLDRGLSLLEETLALQEASLGVEHPLTLTTMNNLGDSYRDAGKIDRALPLLMETLRLRTTKLGPEHADTLTTMNNLALGYRAAGKFDRALLLLGESLTLMKAKLGPGHPVTINTMSNLAQGYLDAGKLDQAVALLRELVDLEKRQDGADSPGHARVLTSIGLAFLQQRSWSDAAAVLRESLAIREAKEPGAWTTFNTRSLLGGALLGQKEYADAEPLLRAGYEGMKQRVDKLPPPGKLRLLEALDRLIELAKATNNLDGGQRWKDEKAKLIGASAPKHEAKKR